jgi:stearoyl-CoA desaturase (Delta-9 desaturase)
MTRAVRIANISVVVIPFVAFLVALATLWNDFVGPRDLVIGFVMYAVTLLGVTIGFHRYLTHRAFQTSKPVEYALAILGSMAIEGPVVNWVADHRKHHAHTDQEGDPHSPHGFGPGLLGTLKGLFHAHVGWLWEDHGIAERTRYAPDLVEDRGMRIINLSFGPLALLSLAIPFFAGWAIGGSLHDGLTAFLWGSLVRVFLLHHVTWSINSICHFFGRRRFVTTDQSTNVFWLALPSFGEAWHHNHHAFPRSAFHGLRKYEIDVAGWVILALEKVGLIWDVVRITPERQADRASTPPPARISVGST